MALLDKRFDREDWLRYAIAFMQRGLWLAREIEVHGPHDRSGFMWGNACATPDNSTDNTEWECIFIAKARRSKYDPINIRIRESSTDDLEFQGKRFPLVKTSTLTPQARRWLQRARRQAAKLRRERRAA